MSTMCLSIRVTELIQYEYTSHRDPLEYVRGRYIYKAHAQKTQFQSLNYFNTSESRTTPIVKLFLVFLGDYDQLLSYIVLRDPKCLCW